MKRSNSHRIVFDYSIKKIPMIQRICSSLLAGLVLSPVSWANPDTLQPVSVVYPKEAPSIHQISVTGTIKASQRSKLSTSVDGLISHLFVDTGDHVRQGDKLLTLDMLFEQHEAKRLAALVNAAEFELKEAKRLSLEADELAKKKHFPRTERDLRRLRVKRAEQILVSAQAAFDKQQFNVSKHTLVAPFDGVITQKHVEVGEWIDTGETTLELVSSHQLRLDVYLPQQEYKHLNQDKTIVVTTDLAPEKEFPATIQAIVPDANERSRTFLTRLTIEQVDNQLIPGIAATALFRFQTQQSPSLFIPSDALVSHPDGGYSVFVIQNIGTVNQIASRRVIRIGKQTEQGIEVRSGLSVQDPIVIRGNERLKDQDKVELTPLKGIM